MHIPDEQRRTASVQPEVNGGSSGDHSRTRDVPLSNVITSLTTAILATVAYYDQFDRPLTTLEIAQRLLGWSADEATVAAELAQSSQAQRALLQEESYYSVAGRAGLACQYQELAVVRAQKWRRVEGFTRAARRLPFVHCIIVGGSLADGSVGPESDLDLCVLTAERRLWLTRASLIALRSLWNAARPKPLRRPKQDKIDILRMVSASGFTSHHQSLYAAILLRDGVVVHDEHETADRYVAANTWVLPYCPGFAALRQHEIQPSRRRLMGKRALEWLFSAPVFDGAERMVYHWWRRRWERDRWAVESPSQPMVATPSVADFHSYYWEDRVLSGALERFAALGLLPSVESSATCAQTQVVGGEIVALTATPGRFGTYTFTVELVDASGVPTQGAVVDLQLNMPDLQMGSLRVHLAPVNPPIPGAYQAQGVLSMKGQWQAVVQIITPGATQPVQATFRFPAQYY